MKGLVHLYCGDGKGKTTAAAGLALRGAGAGMKVVFVQFLKGSGSGEIDMFRKIENVTVIRNYKDMGFVSGMSPDEIEELRRMHNKSIDSAMELVHNGQCDMLILDEVCAAYKLNVLDRNRIDDIIDNRPDSMELVMTGRDPERKLIDSADYITEMKMLRHPFEKNIKARKGIEY